MRNLLLSLRFDGTAYHGWQVQKNALTVQQVFQDAVASVLGVRADVTGCSRTDAGVHANMYCCQLRTEHPIPEPKLIDALNFYLPRDIGVFACREVSQDFHARYSCQSKEYIYKIWNSPFRSPFYEGYALHCKRRIDENFLNGQAQAYIGTYDYSGFSSSGSSVAGTVRTVKNFTVLREGEVLVFTVEADGFLYNMVRIMTGTLLEIAEGKIPPDMLKEIIISGERGRAGRTAPACGLYLNRVFY